MVQRNEARKPTEKFLPEVTVSNLAAEHVRYEARILHERVKAYLVKICEVEVDT